jgi:hypothetical protein
VCFACSSWTVGKDGSIPTSDCRFDERSHFFIKQLLLSYLVQTTAIKFEGKPLAFFGRVWNGNISTVFNLYVVQIKEAKIGKRRGKRESEKERLRQRVARATNKRNLFMQADNQPPGTR